MGRVGKLLTNTAIFAVANFGSKFLSFLLVPLYTWVLSTQDYGTVDLIVTTVSLLVPIMTLGFSDGVLRFAMDPEQSRKGIYSSAMVVIGAGNLLLLLLLPVLGRIPELGRYLGLLYLILFFNCLYSVSAQFCRGIGCSWPFALSGIVQTAALVGGNLLFLLVFRLGVVGYLYSLVISYLSGFLCVFLGGKLYRHLGRLSDLKLLKQMAIYALPLIPNTFFWWAMNGADRYIIWAVIGNGANGIYGVAHKIPTILNMINVVFFQAWQLSAIEEVNAADREAYYSEIFRYLSGIMTVAMSAILVFLRPVFSVWVAPDYYEGWQYTPLLMMATLFTCFASFWGTHFIAVRNTKAVFATTVFGFLVNLVLNVILIPRFGLMGAAFSTAMGYLATWITRVIRARRDIHIQIPWKELGISLLLLCGQMVVLFQPRYLLPGILFFMAVVVVNRKTVARTMKKMLEFLCRRKEIK